MKKLFAFGALLLSAVLLSFGNLYPAFAAGGTDSWTSVPANCVGAQTSPQHICEFIHTQVKVGADSNPFDYWNHVTVEPGVVTDVTCQTHGNNIFRLLGAAPRGGNKDNPWKGSHYGNVAICNGWINGGNGPVDMTVTYQ